MASQRGQVCSSLTTRTASSPPPSSSSSPSTKTSGIWIELAGEPGTGVSMSPMVSKNPSFVIRGDGAPLLIHDGTFDMTFVLGGTGGGVDGFFLRLVKLIRGFLAGGNVDGGEPIRYRGGGDSSGGGGIRGSSLPPPSTVSSVIDSLFLLDMYPLSRGGGGNEGGGGTDKELMFEEGRAE